MQTMNAKLFLEVLTLKKQESAHIAYGDSTAMNLLYNWGFTDSKGGNDLGKVSYCIIDPARFVDRLTNYVHTCYCNNGVSRQFKKNPHGLNMAVLKEVNLQMTQFEETNDTPYDMEVRTPHIYGRGTISHSSTEE